MKSIQSVYLCAIFLTSFAVLMIFTGASCGRIERYQTAEPGQSIPDAALELPVADIEGRERVELRTAVIDGYPYLRELLPGANLYYEPWIDYQVVEQARDAYFLTNSVIAQEFGIVDLPPVAIYLVLDDRFGYFVEPFNLPDLQFLYGLYSPASPQGKHQDEAQVYLKAEAENLINNIGHEITHGLGLGLPHWISEGIADYIGTRVEKGLNPESQQRRLLMSRQLVRDAVVWGTLLDQNHLEQFDPTDGHARQSLELFYAQPWHMVEYIARLVGSDGLRSLIDEYAKAGQNQGFILPNLIGMPEEKFWELFNADIVGNLTAKEKQGVSICRLAKARKNAADTTKEWNRVLSVMSIERLQVDTKQIRNFSQRFVGLASEVDSLDLLGEIAITRDLLRSYFLTMAQAMDNITTGDITNADESLVIANDQWIQSTLSLEAEMLAHPWLLCGPTNKSDGI